MKKTLLLLAIPFALYLGSCQNCGPVTKADLMHIGTEFAMSAFDSGNPATLGFNIAGDFLNAAEVLTGKCACATTTVEANSQSVDWKVYTSDDGGASPADLLLNESVPKSNLIACAEDKTGIKCEFLKSGYYIVTNVLDFLDNVDERIETNNSLTGKSNFKSAKELYEYEKAKYGANFKSQVIYIDVDNTAYEVDENGKQILVKLHGTF